jgi:hypothetical protein
VCLCNEEPTQGGRQIDGLCFPLSDFVPIRNCLFQSDSKEKEESIALQCSFQLSSISKGIMDPSIIHNDSNPNLFEFGYAPKNRGRDNPIQICHYWLSVFAIYVLSYVLLLPLKN